MNLLRFIKHKTIVNCFRDRYLTRIYLWKGKRVGIHLHIFHRSDEDRALHDHPWNFITIILWRGYHEWATKKIEHAIHGMIDEVYTRKRYWPGMILFRRAEWKHRVELINQKPAVTLFIRFRDRRNWGYHFSDGWKSHDQWWSENCE